ncbi:MAG: hypothetical protein IPP71_23485 [Bacteroidetes bacterium]|nr:hypothetical protein [Bacteroidota bacterium]
MIAKQQLYDELINDPILVASDTVYQNFVDDKQFTSIGYLQEGSAGFKNSTVIDGFLYSSIKTADSLCKDLVSEIVLLDSLLVDNSSIILLEQRNDLIDDLNFYHQTLQNLINQNHIDSYYIRSGKQ